MDVYVHKVKLGFRITMLSLVLFSQILVLIVAPILLPPKPIQLFTVISITLVLVTIMVAIIKSIWVKDWDKPVLRIDKNGVYDRRIFIKQVPWENLEWVHYYVKGNPAISLYLLQFESAYAKKAGSLEKIQYGVAKCISFPKYTIDIMSFSISSEEIKSEFEKYKKSYSESN